MKRPTNNELTIILGQYLSTISCSYEFQDHIEFEGMDPDKDYPDIYSTKNWGTLIYLLDQYNLDLFNSRLGSNALTQSSAKDRWSIGAGSLEKSFTRKAGRISVILTMVYLAQSIDDNTFSAYDCHLSGDKEYAARRILKLLNHLSLKSAVAKYANDPKRAVYDPHYLESLLTQTT